MGKPPFERSLIYLDGWRLLSSPEKSAIVSALELFREDPNHPSLRKHTPRGYHSSIVSISADDDLRILLRIRTHDSFLLLDVGNHERVYGE